MQEEQQKDIDLGIPVQTAIPIAEIQLGDIVLRSNKHEVKELTKIVKDLLKNKEVQSYLGILSKQRMSYLGRMTG